jgi:hypothetical protein
MSDTIKLQTLLLVNDFIIPLNDFTQQYIGNVMSGIVASLGFSSTRIVFSLNNDELKLFAGDKEVPVKKDFVRQIVTSTIKGVLSPLEGFHYINKLSLSISD